MRFVWSNNVGLTGATTSTRCVNPNVNLYNVDLGCGEAVVFAQTIDEDETGLSYVTFQDGYGFPAYASLGASHLLRCARVEWAHHRCWTT